MIKLRNAGSMKHDKEFNMREIVIDTETTGLDPLDGHRIVEIGAVGLVNRGSHGPSIMTMSAAWRNEARYLPITLMARLTAVTNRVTATIGVVTSLRN
jgi:Exonuclease